MGCSDREYDAEYERLQDRGRDAQRQVNALIIGGMTVAQLRTALGLNRSKYSSYWHKDEVEALETLLAWASQS